MLGNPFHCSALSRRSTARARPIDCRSRLLSRLQADLRFLWNHYMLEVLIDNKLEPYLLPVIQGSFQNFQVEIGKEIVDVTLIARRCTRRTGGKKLEILRLK
ncbi:hypothetical protein MRB53_021853 [Persea americana]|nr:hypothetical protein MRB53_021853 [Persea americana]